MTNEKKLIDANACPCIKCDRLGNCRPGFCETFAEWWLSPVDAVEVVYCDNCVTHGSCVFESMLHCLGYKKPFCCAGKMDGDEDD